MRITDKREQRLMTAAPEALETERSSIQRFADKMEIDRGIGLLDAGGLQLERELLDWYERPITPAAPNDDACGKDGR